MGGLSRVRGARGAAALAVLLTACLPGVARSRVPTGVEGVVRSAEDGGPQTAVPVQAVRVAADSGEPLVVVTTLTDAGGRYRMAGLEPGTYHLWCGMPGDARYPDATGRPPLVVQVEPGALHSGMDFRLAVSPSASAPLVAAATRAAAPDSIPPLARLQPLSLTSTYTARDGARPSACAVADTQGYTWFGPVSAAETFHRFDGRSFAAADSGGALWAGRLLWGASLARDAHGTVWRGGDAGLIRLWNGAVERHFAVRDGLPSNAVVGVRADREDGVWVLTARGLTYIHSRDGEDEVLVAADSATVGLPEGVSDWDFDVRSLSVAMQEAAQGGVWWSVTPRGSSVTVLHRLAYAPSGIREVQRLCFGFGLTGAWPVGEGLLVQADQGLLIHYPARGPGRTLDPRLTELLGWDARDRLFFGTAPDDGLFSVVRDGQSEAGAFGSTDCPGRFVFPTRVPEGYRFFSRVGEGLWAFASLWLSGQPVLALGENGIEPVDAATYPFVRTGSRFAAPDPSTTWVMPWGQRQVTEMRFVPGVRCATPSPDLNGLWPQWLDPASDRYLFIRDPGRELWYHDLGAWRQLTEEMVPQGVTADRIVDAQGTTWVRGPGLLVRIGHDGVVLQESLPSTGMAPDDRGGCYLVTPDSALVRWDGRRVEPCPVPGETRVREVYGPSGGDLYLRTAEGLCRWPNAEPERLVPVEGLPPDSAVAGFTQTAGRLFVRTARLTGQVTDGRASFLDTLRYPELSGLDKVQVDAAGRTLLYGVPQDELIREIWRLDRDSLRCLPLPAPCLKSQVVAEAGEVIAMTPDCRLFRFSEEQQQFYLLFNGGDLFGYVWGALLKDGHLLVSGWGKPFVDIELSRCPPLVPRLSFRGATLGGAPVPLRPRYELSARSVLTVEYLGIDRFGQEQVLYQTRVAGLDTSWSGPTRDESIRLRNLPAGAYRLEVRCQGESGVWGDPIGVDLQWRPPWYHTAWARTAYGLAFLGLLAGAVALTRRRMAARHAREMARVQQDAERRVLEAQKEELERELQTAHDMQMGLMPREAPRLAGVEVAGRCRPANHVGGDLYKYYRLPDGRLMGVLADVSGHGMEAAVPLLVFTGLLESHLELGGSLTDLVNRLNGSLCRTLTGRTFICLAMAELEPDSRLLQVVNAGCPHPYHYRAAGRQLVELEADAYPLGVRPDTAYQMVEARLEAGDWVVFCSDGIPEAENAAGETFGYERLAAAVSEACAAAGSATELLDRLFAAVSEFSGQTPQADDQTAVVLRVQGLERA